MLRKNKFEVFEDFKFVYLARLCSTNGNMLNNFLTNVSMYINNSKLMD